jgi:chromosomal replication initiation ATPase DnaA
MKIVIQEVAKVFGVTEGQLMGNQRWYPLALARHVAMVLCLESHPFASSIVVARYFRRHRSMCVHAVRKVDEACQTNPKVRVVVENLREKLCRRLDKRSRVA